MSYNQVDFTVLNISLAILFHFEIILEKYPPNLIILSQTYQFKKLQKW